MIGAACALALAAPGVAAAASSKPAALSRHPVAESQRWRSYVLDPQQPAVYPTKVEVTSGAAGVQNPDGLKAPGGGATTITSTGGDAPQLVLDLGVNTGGTIEVGLKDGTGAPVHLAYAEARRYLTPLGDNVEGSLGSNDAPDGRYDVLPGVAGTWTSPAVRGGQRWISLTLDGPGSVSIDYVRVHVTHLRSRVADYRGHFLSNDDTVNRAWYASAYTYDTAVTGDPPVLMDGAKRDRMVFTGDLSMGQLTGLDAVHAGAQVARNSLRIFSCQQSADGDIPGNSNTDVKCPEDPPTPTGQDNTVLRSGEYMGWYTVAAEDYDWRTGDHAYIRKLLPVLRRAAGFLEAHMKDDLYAGNPPPAVEYGWQAGGGSGPGTYTNIVIYQGFRALADLERRLGDGAKAGAAYDAVAAKIRAALLARAVDKATGTFLTHPDDTSGIHPQDANVEAVTAGIFKGAVAARALQLVRDRMWTQFGTKYADQGSVYISPFAGSLELRARAGHGDATGALELIRSEWGHMLAGDPGSTVWEKVGLDGLPQPNQPNTGGQPTNRPEGEGYVSLSHAWSSGPVSALSDFVLGVRATAPGFARWTVAPQVGDLRWAQGTMPTPRGRIVSRWRRGGGDSSFRLTVNAPRRTSGTVAVPLLGRARTIARNGRIVWRHGRAARGVRAKRHGGAVVFSARPGRGTYAW